MNSRGVVRRWDAHEMSGVIDSDDTPGGSWTRWFAVAVAGFPGFVEGQQVEFEWDRLDQPTHGFEFQTVRAWPVGTEPVTPATGFSSGAWHVDPDGTVHELTDALDDRAALPPRRVGRPASGVVSAWHGEEGWGVIDSPDTPGGCWVYWSALHPDEVIDAQPGNSFSIGGGIHGLEIAEQVDFEWEPVPDQDGYTFRAIRVRPRREVPLWRIERHAI